MRGNLLSEKNAKDELTQYGYDARGERTSVTDPRGYPTDLQYDLVGRNYRVEDPDHNVTTFGFDDLDRMTSETRQLSGGGSQSRSYQYDLAGNRTLAVDRRGRATVYGYDERNQLRSETWYLTAADAQAQMNPQGGIGYGYDVVGRLQSAGSESFTYDNLDRTQTQTFSYLAAPAILTTTYGSRKDGLRDTLKATIGGTADFINQYDYDERLWLKSVTQSAQQGTGGHFVATKQVVFQHGDDGRLEHLLRYADLPATQLVAQTDFAYDDANRLTGINHFKPASGGNVGLAQYTWNYDDAGRIKNLTSPDGSVTYGYDDRGQLTGADYTGASQPADAVYPYDGNGNRTDTGFVTGDHNEPQTDGTYSYTYDAEGNRTGRTNLSTGEYDVYQWDNRNRLTGVVHFAANNTQLWTVAYVYDYANRLIARSQIVGQNTVTEQFVYDGNQIVLQTDGAGNVTHRYLWGESVDQILADESVDLVSNTSTTRWTLTDHLNTVRDLATYDTAFDETTIIDHIIYDAFGKVTAESSPGNSTDFKFTGHFTDPQTGLQWNLNRWYDPGLHQWLSVDPILFDAGDPNPRRYVDNDPVNFLDSDGLERLPTAGVWRASADPASKLVSSSKFGNAWFHAENGTVAPVRWKDSEPQFETLTKEVAGWAGKSKVKLEVTIDSSGVSDTDIDRAKRAAKANWGKGLPEGTWHHKSFDKTSGKFVMQLVDSNTHTINQHSGGYAKFLDWVAATVSDPKKLKNLEKLDPDRLVGIVKALRDPEIRSRINSKLAARMDDVVAEVAQIAAKKGYQFVYREGGEVITKVVGVTTKGNRVVRAVARIPGGKILTTVIFVVPTAIALNSEAKAQSADGETTYFAALATEAAKEYGGGNDIKFAWEIAVKEPADVAGQWSYHASFTHGMKQFDRYQTGPLFPGEASDRSANLKFHQELQKFRQEYWSKNHPPLPLPWDKDGK